MKKLMIGILFLIPIIIILSVNVSGMIISSSINISVESILLKNQNEYIENVLIDYGEYDSEYKYYKIETLCYPALAKPSLVWTSSDMNIAYVDNGKVYFIGYGEVYITCTSSENTSISASCRFFISGDKIYSIALTRYPQTEEINNISLAENDRILLDKLIVPANSLQDKPITWSTSNEEVATVDSNGVVTALDVGTCDITLSILEDDVWHSDSTTITVHSGNSLITQSQLYVSGNTLNLSPYLMDNTSILDITTSTDTATITGTTVTNTSGIENTVNISIANSEYSDTATVIFTNGELLIGVENLDILQSTIWQENNYIWAGSASYYLKPIVLNVDYTGNPTFIYTPSDNDKLTINNGLLAALNGGSLDVVISCDGFTSLTVPIIIKVPMQNVSLSLDNRRDNVGLEGKRVFGIYSLLKDTTGNYINNEYKLGISTCIPEDADQESTYSTSNSHYATVDENGLITFNEAGANKHVTIRIFAKYTVSAQPVTDYYEFYLIDAVNVGLGISSSQNNDENPLFDIYDDVRYLLGDNVNQYAVVLHTDVYVPYEMDSYDIYNSLYGNGYKYDGQFRNPENISYNSRLLTIDENRIVDTVEIRNLVMLTAAYSTDFMTYAYTGMCLNISNCNADKAYKTVIVRYSRLENAYTGIYHNGGNLIVDGCIIRNMLCSGVSIDVNETDIPNFTLNNSILSNTNGPTIIMYTVFDLDKIGEVFAAYPTITLTGDNYIYNWKDTTNINLRILPPDNAFVLRGVDLSATFNNMIDDIVEQEFSKDKYDPFKVSALSSTVGNTDLMMKHLNFGIFVTGIWEDTDNFGLEYDENEFMVAELNVADTEAGNVLNVFGGSKNDFSNPCKLIVPSIDNGLSKTMPNDTYEINDRTLSILRGK